MQGRDSSIEHRGGRGEPGQNPEKWGCRTLPGTLRHDGTCALQAETDSKVKASLGFLVQSCQKKKITTWKSAKMTWKHRMKRNGES